MLVLALDASTPVTTVALGEVEGDERVLFCEVALPGAEASETLLRAVESALSLGGREFSEVGGIVVGVGPGAFTGIRIACATARSLALGSGASLMANSTLTALAAPALDARPEGSEVLAVLDARRGEVFARRFVAGESSRDTITPESIFCGKPEQLLAEISNYEDPLIVGDGAVRYREDLSALGDIPPYSSALNRVSAVGHLLSVKPEFVGAEGITPVYVREPDAEVRRDLNPWLGG
ncbi:MAG: tRNA (adenosine(37)-N6)-threonylcarbamoyltransferase complex dimerization subunit type 1 TsaB [Rubrobacter sp.]